MPSREYRTKTRVVKLNGKKIGTIPAGKWKGPGTYYRRNASWTKRDFGLDAKLSTPGKAKNIGSGNYSQYHDLGRGKQNRKSIPGIKITSSGPTGAFRKRKTKTTAKRKTKTKSKKRK